MIFTSSLRKNRASTLLSMRKAIARQTASQIVETIAGLRKGGGLFYWHRKCAIGKAAIKSFEKIKKSRIVRVELMAKFIRLRTRRGFRPVSAPPLDEKKNIQSK